MHYSLERCVDEDATGIEQNDCIFNSKVHCGQSVGDRLFAAMTDEELAINLLLLEEAC